MEKIKYSRVFYPGYFGLTEKTSYCIYKDGSILGIVHFIKHHVALEMIDLNSKVKITEKGNKGLLLSGVTTGIKNGVVVDKDSMNKVGFDFQRYFPLYNMDDFALYFDLNPLPRLCKNMFISEFIVSHEFRGGDDKNDNSNVKEILKIFVSKYRELTRDINIKLPTDTNWNIFGLVGSEIRTLSGRETTLSALEALKLNYELKEISSNQLNFDMRRDFIQGSKPKSDFEKTSIELDKEFDSQNKIDEFIKQINKVNEEIDIGDEEHYKLALLNIFIYCEYFVTHFLKEKKINQGISQKKIDEIEVTFSYLLNIELPLVIGEFNDEWKSIIGDVNWVRRKRNDVIHEGDVVSKEEALKALESITRLINKIKNLN